MDSAQTPSPDFDELLENVEFSNCTENTSVVKAIASGYHSPLTATED